jgi:hypothetical protein
MSISLEAIADDPALYLLNLRDSAAYFQTMSRDSFHRSIFLDDRIVRAGQPSFEAPLDTLLGNEWPATTTRPVRLIYHVAQCGSTLLARALDLPGRDLVLREPAALRRLGVMVGSSRRPEASLDNPEVRALLPFVLSMLGKRWDAGAPVIVKANVPVNFIAREIMELEPDTAAILLHFPLVSYVAAVMRTEAHERWVESIFAEMGLVGSPWAEGAEPATTAERAACLWFAQMKQFETLAETYPNVRSLSAERLFDEPAETLVASADLFGLSLSRGEADEIVAGDVFATYSKNPALDYDPEVRAARESVARRRLGSQIGEAEQWARAARGRHGLVEALGAPLIGDPIPLLD